MKQPRRIGRQFSLRLTRHYVLFVALVCVLGIAAGCSLFVPKGTVEVTNNYHARVYCEFRWGPENKAIYVDSGATESCPLAAGSYTFYVTEAVGGAFVESLYFILDANTTQPITIPD